MGGGWLDQLELMLTQLSTGLKVEAELGKRKNRKILKNRKNNGSEVIPVK